EPVEVGNWHTPIQFVAAVAPPTTTVGGHLASTRLTGTQLEQLSVHGLAPFPVLELHRSQAVTQPFIQCAKDSRRLRQTEIRFPAQQIGPELFDHLSQTTPTVTAG